MVYRYRIFQLPINNKFCFVAFDEAMSHDTWGGRFDYVSVYAASIDADSIGDALEHIWRLHNADDRPSGRCFRSLSMSDVVTIDGIPYYCDRFGWSEIPGDRWNP